MSKIQWKSATLSQLYCIAYDDPMALPSDRRRAMEEILRQKQRRKKVRYKESVQRAVQSEGDECALGGQLTLW